MEDVYKLNSVAEQEFRAAASKYQEQAVAMNKLGPPLYFVIIDIDKAGKLYRDFSINSGMYIALFFISWVIM